MNNTRYCWKYFRKFCCRCVVHPSSGRGWEIILALCPFLFVIVRWNACSWDTQHLACTDKIENRLAASLFPGFPTPGGTVKFQIDHVFSTETTESPMYT